MDKKANQINLWLVFMAKIAEVHNAEHLYQGQSHFRFAQNPSNENA